MVLRTSIRSHMHKWIHSWSMTPVIFSWWFSAVALHYLECNWRDTIRAIPAVSFLSHQAQVLWWQQEQWGLKWHHCGDWRVFAAGDPTKSFCTARRGGCLHARHFSACATFLPVSYCVITSSLEVFIKKLEPLAEARRPPLFCAKLDSSAKPSSSCIHVRKSKSSISLQCLQCMYITQQQSVC